MESKNVGIIEGKDNVDREVDARLTLERVLPDYAALRQEELVQVNLDIPAAVITILGALPEIKGLRAQLAPRMNKEELELFDKLEDYTVACQEAHSRYLSVTQSPSELAAIVQEAQQARDRLLADALALANRGLADGSQLKELSGVVGYKNLSVDLSIIVQTLRAAWPNIQGKSPITEAELDRAHKLHLYLMRVVGLKEQGSAAISAATDLRIRAFTLLLRTYEHVRRFVSFLRYHEEDLETIAPTLYAGRPRRKPSEQPNVPGTQPPATPTAGTTTGAPPAVSTSASNATAASPISEPFMS